MPDEPSEPPRTDSRRAVPPDTVADAVGSPAATAGVVVAAVALVGAVPWWPGDPVVALGSLGSPLAAALALVSALAFSARRFGLLDRQSAAGIAGAAGATIAAVSAVRLVAPAAGNSYPISAGYGLPVAMVAGLGILGVAVADYRGVGVDRLVEMGVGVLAGLGLTVAGFVGILLVGLPLRALLEVGASPAQDLVLQLIVSPLAEVAFVAVALGYVFVTDRGWDYVDFERPTAVGIGLAILATLGLLVLQFATIAVIQVLGLPSSSQGTMQRAAREAAELGQPEIVLVLAPMMLLVVGPAEELLFRNVVQKRLYEAFARKSAVLVAGVVFAAAHLLSYASESAAAVFVSLASIFFISLLLGFLYEYTENLTVAALAHGLYNATLVVLLYVGLVAQQYVEEGSAVIAVLGI
ncbi:MAG: type II CAAX endopeptidase family protein [Halobacteriales archaeon]